MSLPLLVAGVVLNIAPVGDDPGEVVVSATGAEADTHLIFYRADGETGGKTPLFGQTKRLPDLIEFRPSFGLSWGVLYRAEVSSGKEVLLSRDYQVPERKGERPRILRVMPWGIRSGEVENVVGTPRTPYIPANLLKFYIVFDQPMREGKEIFDLIELIDADGNVVESPWRRQEIWADDAKRLNLFIHPGRIKQGVNLREELGPVLRPDGYYTLRFSGALRDAEGRRLSDDAVAAEFDYVTGPEIRERIDPSLWELSLPEAGSKDALLIHTERAMDPFLFRRHVSVEGVETEPATWFDGQEHFFLYPVKPWEKGTYKLVINEYLEDLAGNTPVRVFDTDLEQPDPGSPVLEVPFRIP